MKVVALVSGGKDSTFNMMQCIAAGHEIVALANLVPYNKNEIDSYMYQSVGHEAIDLIAKAIDLPLFKRTTYGVAQQKGKTYNPCKDDEVEDLFLLLEEVKKVIDFDAVSVGAILSDYQRVRVENVCGRLNVTALAYLWQRNQAELLDEMINCEVDAIIIKVASLGLDPKKHLSRSLSLLQPHLLEMHEKYSLNVCGEGGEYETLTLDCPLFKSRIVIESSEIVMHQNDPIAPVGFLKLNSLRLEVKLPILDLAQRLDGLPLKDSYGYIKDITEENEDDLNLLEATTDYVVSLKNVPSKPLCGSNNGRLFVGSLESNSSSLEDILNNLVACLELKGHTLKDVCSITLYIKDMSQFGILNQLYIQSFCFDNPPVRACVEVPMNNSVIIEVISWNPEEDEGERNTMHVQSRSHWAPCNIGPYSQATKVGSFIYLAGQIGLIPGSMEMVSGGIKPQCKLVIRHIDRVLKAVDSSINIREVVQGICYVTNISYIEEARKLWEEKTNNAIVEYVVVSGLPRNAAVEWQVWAHRYNNQFEYEERGKCIDKYTISLYRRVNYDDNIAATVCRVSSNEILEFNVDIFRATLDYLLEKLENGLTTNNKNSLYNLKIYFSLTKFTDVIDLKEIAETFTNNLNLVYTFIPVIELKNDQTFMSICGVCYG